MKEIKRPTYEFETEDVKVLQEALKIMQALQSQTNWTPYQDLQPIERELWDIAGDISDIFESY